MDMRHIINVINEAIKPSRYATTVPSKMPKERTPVGKYLFHGTNLDCALNIIRVNEISTGGEWRGEGNRVALTRSYAVAQDFGTHNDGGAFPAAFVLDWRKLAAKYQVVPYRDVDCNGEYFKNSASEDGTEQEEAVYGAIRPLSQFCLSINVDPEIMQSALNEDDFAEWCIEEKGFFKTPRAVKGALERLSKSPVFNRLKG